jgi:putative nucleotidyltransferase with HDIG domain
MQFFLILVGLLNLSLVLFGITSVRKTNFLKNYFVVFSLLIFLWALTFCPLFYFTTEFTIFARYIFVAFIIGQALIIFKSFYTQNKISRKEIIIQYSISLFFSLIASLNISFFEREYFVSLENLSAIFFLSYIFYYFISLARMIYLMGKSHNKFIGNIQQQAKYMFLGIIVFLSMEFIAVFILPSCGYVHYRVISVAGTIFFISCNLYAVLRYHLMDIHIILKRSTIYSVMVLFIVSIYMLTSMFFDYLNTYFVGFNFIAYRIIVSLLIAFSYMPLRTYLEDKIDKIFFPHYYKYASALHKFSERMTSILDLRELLDTIVINVLDIFNIHSGALFLFDREQKKFIVKAEKGFSNSIREIDFNMNSSLVVWLKKNKKMWIKSLYNQNEKRATSIEEKMNLLNAELCVPLIFDDKIIGFIVLGEKNNNLTYLREEINLIKTIQYEVAVSLINAISYNELKKNYIETVEALAKAIEAKDKNTLGHSERVQEIAVEIAKELKCPRTQIEILKYAGILHDIGKISIDDTILKKTEPLDEKELAVIKTHPVTGEDILNHIDFFDEVKSVIRHHHERWDGEGYPDQLKSRDISILSRILQVADSLDAMVSPRVYKKPKSVEEAIEELKKCNGSQFDPLIIDCIEKIFSENPDMGKSFVVR